MKEEIKDLILEMTDIKEISEYEFHNLCGFTFVFKREFLQFRDDISSASIAPVGIIYDENEEYYFAPFAEDVNVKEIIEKNSGIKILDGELTSDSYGMIVKKGNTELLETVNKVLNRLSSDGSIDNFIIKHTEE